MTDQILNHINKTDNPGCNGQDNTEAFQQAFGIFPENNRIKVRATAEFQLSITGLTVPEGAIGIVLGSCDDGRIFIDFGFRQCVVIVPLDSHLIEPVTEAVTK